MSETDYHYRVNKVKTVFRHFDKLVKALDRWRSHNWIKGRFPDEIDELWILLRRKKGRLERNDLTRVSRVALVSFDDNLVAARKFVNRAWLPWNVLFWLLVLTTPSAELRRLREAVDESMKIVLTQSQETSDSERYVPLKEGMFSMKKEKLYINRLR